MDADLSAARVRLERMAEWLRDNAEEWGEPDAVAIDVILAALAEAQETEPAIVRAFVERVDARAEADMLTGSPLEGAHCRAMQEELRLMEAHADGEAQEAAPPLRLRLWCPHCGTQHIDQGEWAARPHHRHLCASCGHIWDEGVRCYGVAEAQEEE